MTSISILVLIASQVTARSCPGGWGYGAMRAGCGIIRFTQLPEPRSGHCMPWVGGWVGWGGVAGNPGQSESEPSQAFAVAPVGDRQS